MKIVENDFTNTLGKIGKGIVKGAKVVKGTYDYFNNPGLSKIKFDENALDSDVKKTKFGKYLSNFKDAKIPYSARRNREHTAVQLQFDARAVPKRFADKINPDNKSQSDSLYSYITSYKDHIITMIFPNEDIKDEKQPEQEPSEQDKVPTNYSDDDNWSADEVSESIMVPTPTPYHGDQVDTNGKTIKKKKGKQFMRKIGESFEDESSYQYIKSKPVTDSDGFLTDYTMYYNIDEDKYIFIWGDQDVYSPSNTEPDWETDSKEEADEWFDNYDGFEEEDPFSPDDIWNDNELLGFEEESLEESVYDNEEYIREVARDDYKAGMPVNDYSEFVALLRDDGIEATEELYNVYLDSYNEASSESDDFEYESLTLKETPGLSLSDFQVKYEDQDDHEGYISVKINDKFYEYKLNPGIEMTASELVSKVNKIQKYSDGKALAYLKKNTHLKEANYGGAYDIDPKALFTRDDLHNLGEKVCDHLNETFSEVYDISRLDYFPDQNTIWIEVESPDTGNYETHKKIDLRKLPNPSRLADKYAMEFAADLIAQIKRDMGLTESSSLYPPTILDQIRSDVESKFYDIAVNDGQWAFESKEEVKDFLDPYFDVYHHDDNNYSFGSICVEVRFETDYDGLVDMAEKLDPVVQKYDKEAYFEADQPGIIQAYISYDNLRTLGEGKQIRRKSKRVTESYYDGKISVQVLDNLKDQLEYLIEEMEDQGIESIQSDPSTYGIYPPFIATSSGYIELNNTDKYLGRNEDEEEYESLHEDWRSGEFTKDDLSQYEEKITSEAYRLSRSLNKMIKDHSEYKEEIKSLIASVRNIFDLQYNNLGESLHEGNSFKDYHICQGCGKPLSQCTCEIDEEESLYESLSDMLDSEEYYSPIHRNSTKSQIERLFKELRSDIKTLARCDSVEDVASSTFNVYECNRIISRIMQRNHLTNKDFSFEEAQDNVLRFLYRTLEQWRVEAKQIESQVNRNLELYNKVKSGLNQDYELVRSDEITLEYRAPADATQKDCVEFVDKVVNISGGKYYGTGRGGSWTRWDILADGSPIKAGWGSNDNFVVYFGRTQFESIAKKSTNESLSYEDATQASSVGQHKSSSIDLIEDNTLQVQVIKNPDGSVTVLDDEDNLVDQYETVADATDAGYEVPLDECDK